MYGSKSVASLNLRLPAAGGTPAELADRAQRAQRRAERELAARHEAERLLETKSLELFAANQRLCLVNAELEERVEARTKQLDDARRAAVDVGSHDYLTGLANRMHYSAHLEGSLSQPRAKNSPTALLLADLDGFKLINDTYGHRHGDQLLIEIARRLESIARRSDLVARIGGDEFAVVIKRTDSSSVEMAANRFGRVFDKPMTIHGVTIKARGSLGLAICPEHCNNAVDLQRFADLALYKSKRNGEGKVITFEKRFLRAYEFRQRMEAEFRGALERGAIDLVYQPIVRLHDGVIDAVEALARWTDSKDVEISPAYFIPLAEECGIIRGVGRSLLEKALLETRCWIDHGLIERVSFNVSPLELVDKDFADSVLQMLAIAGVAPRHLLLEITERAAIQNLDLVERVMTKLRRKGIRFALDDFGCGYSDLSTLRKLPISVLKIDRTLLVDAETDQAARVILRNVVTLCRELGIRSICEGAETEAQLEILRTIGCDAVQGFVSGRPQLASELKQALRKPSLSAGRAR